jgi:tRNA-splicing ligase RtcB
MLPDDLGPLRSAIEAAVPHGRTDNGGRNDRGAWHDVPKRIDDAFAADAVLDLVEKNPKLARGGAAGLLGRAGRQLGTLGSGNHFIEICLDEEQAVWIMLHSGSRGLGNTLATYYIEEAKRQAARYFYESLLPDPDLAWLSENTPIFDEYVLAVGVAQEYARLNRVLMLEAVRGALRAVGLEHETTDEAVNCHHNYVAREKHFGASVIVTRKGAVRAREGDLGIIPGSMGAKSFIVRGKGNPDSFASCSHGAGRKMGRNQAKRTISLAAFNAAMGTVESRRDVDVIDEAPQAYKDIDAVMAAQADLVDIVHTLKQVCVVKG